MEAPRLSGGIEECYDSGKGDDSICLISLKKSSEELLDANPDFINAKQKSGFSTLHVAARLGFKEIADLLLQRGIDTDVKSDWGFTPIHEACNKGHRSIVELLIINGADVNVRVEKMKMCVTPLSIAIREEQDDIAELLRENGAKE